MGEVGRVEVELDSVLLRPADPACEVRRFDRIAVDVTRTKLAIACMQIESVRARDDGQKLFDIGPELRHGTRLPRVVSGHLDAAA